MVKHPCEKFLKTNGWEFFALDVSEAGTKIRDRGENVVNLSQGATSLSCHQPATRFDFVCEKGHGCAPIPFDDQKLADFSGQILVVHSRTDRASAAPGKPPQRSDLAVSTQDARIV